MIELEDDTDRMTVGFCSVCMKWWEIPRLFRTVDQGYICISCFKTRSIPPAIMDTP